MSYSNTNVQSSTQTTQNRSLNNQQQNIEDQVFQQNQLPNNPDIRIIECPLSQASSSSEDNGSWRNSFREPIFIPAGSEVKVQSCFVESRGISGDILVFDAVNTLTSRNDNTTHIYEFYVNNTGFNDMVLQYDLKARGVATPERDSGHNYKKFQLERYMNIWAREPYFVGGNNLINRIIRTDVDNYIEVDTNRTTRIVDGIETLHRIAPREDPFVSGRYLTSSTPADNQISLTLGSNTCFIYEKIAAGYNQGDMSFYRYGDGDGDKGFIILDFGYDQTGYRQYIAPTKGNPEKYVVASNYHYAMDNFTYGDCIKVQFCCDFVNEDQSTINKADYQTAMTDISVFNRDKGGFLYVGDRIDLNSDEYLVEYNEIVNYLKADTSTGASERLSQFNSGNYSATTTLCSLPSENSASVQQQKKIFNRIQLDNTSTSFFSLGEITNGDISKSGIVQTIYAEISRVPYYAYSGDEQDDNLSVVSLSNGRSGTHPNYLTTPQTCYVIEPNTKLRHYQHKPNINNRLNKIKDGRIQENQGNDTIAPVYFADDILELEYLSGGNETAIITYDITSITYPSNLVAHITITNDKSNGLPSCINMVDLCFINYTPAGDPTTAPSTYGTLGTYFGNCTAYTEGTNTATTTIVVITDLDGLSDNVPATTISFFVNKASKTMLEGRILPTTSQGLTEMSKHNNLNLNAQNVLGTPTFPEYIFQLNKLESGVFLNKPSGFWGNLDTQKDFYNTYMPKLLKEFPKIQECNAGTQNFIGIERVIYPNFGANSYQNDRQNNGLLNFSLTAFTQLTPHIPENHPAQRQFADNNVPFNSFTDASHRKFKYLPHQQSFNYQIPKPYMSPSDISNDYTLKTHKTTGIIDYDNNLEYEDTDRTGIMRNRFIIPVFSSNLSGNTFNTTTGEMNSDMTNGANTGGFQPNSFRAVGKMDDSLLISSNVKTSTGFYYLYFRNQHSPVRIYDPYDATRTAIPVVEHDKINNFDPTTTADAKMWDGSLVAPTNGKFLEQPFPTASTNYPIVYTITQKDTKENVIQEQHGLSQFAGAVNGITLDFNSQLSLFEFSFLHTPFSTEFDKDTNTGGNTAIQIHYPTLQYVDNVEQVSGVKMLNWTKPNYRKGMFRKDEIDTFTTPVYKNGLNPYTSRDPVGVRFMEKLGFSETTLPNYESNPDLFDNTNKGTTGSDIDGSSAIINSKVAVENEPNYQSNKLSGSTTKPAYNGQFLGDRIFYPYGIDNDTQGFSKDNEDIRYDFALPKFSSVGGLRITNHNTGLGLPSTINSFIYTDPNTIPITHNPDFQKYSGYIIQSDSSVMRADNLPSKYNNGYFLLQSSLASDSSNFYLGKDGQGSNVLTTIMKTYISGDFIIQMSSPFAFYTKSDQYVGYVDSTIINSNGDIPSNLGSNSSVIYQISNYSPKNSKEPNTITDIQNTEYKIMEMINQFQDAKDNNKVNPLKDAISTSGQLGELVIHPEELQDNTSIMENLKQRLIDYDVPKMSKLERENFFTNTDIGQRLYEQLQAGQHISDYMNELEIAEEQAELTQFQSPQLRPRVVDRLFDLVQRARDRISTRRYRTYEPTIQKPEPDETQPTIEFEMDGGGRIIRGEAPRIAREFGEDTPYGTIDLHWADEEDEEKGKGFLTYKADDPLVKAGIREEGEYVKSRKGYRKQSYFERQLNNDRRMYDNHTTGGLGRTGLSAEQVRRLSRFGEDLDTRNNPRSQGVREIQQQYTALERPPSRSDSMERIQEQSETSSSAPSYSDAPSYRSSVAPSYATNDPQPENISKETE